MHDRKQCVEASPFALFPSIYMAEVIMGDSVIIQVTDDRTLKVKSAECDLKEQMTVREAEKQQAKYRHWLHEVEDEYARFEEEFQRVTPTAHTHRPSAPTCCIFTVPKALLELKDKQTAYIPQVVSLGPFHFLEPHFASLETIKSEVVRSIQLGLKFHGKCLKSDAVGEIKSHDKAIRDYYDRKIRLGSEVLAWMMARDASFVLRFLAQRLFAAESGQYFVREIETLPLVDTLKDIVKLENQIPLLALRIVLQIDAGIAGEAIPKDKSAAKGKLSGEQDHLRLILKGICSKLSPISIAEFNLGQENHILECLRSFVVGRVRERKAPNDRQNLNCLDSFLYHVFQWFLWIIYILLYPCIWRRDNGEETILPPAVELRKAGVKFKPCQSGIEGIGFDYRKSTLYLPEIKVDIHTEAIMRNVMAFELCCCSCTHKAVTRYAHLMDQLINTEKDARLLSKSHVICNKLENDAKVADFWNSLTDSTSVPKHEAIDQVTEDLKRYYGRRRTTLIILWNEFLEDRCSKPWHVFAFVASIVILLVSVSTWLLRILHK